MLVKFPLVTDSNGSLIYPMDSYWFKNCRVVDGEVIGMFRGDAGDIPEGSTVVEHTTGYSPAPTVYRRILTPREFMSEPYGLSGKQIRDVTKYYEDESNTYADEVYGLWWTATTASYIDLDDPAMLQGLGLLVLLGIITQARLDEIMIGIPE